MNRKFEKGEFSYRTIIKWRIDFVQTKDLLGGKGVEIGRKFPPCLRIISVDTLWCCLETRLLNFILGKRMIKEVFDGA